MPQMITKMTRTVLTIQYFTKEMFSMKYHVIEPSNNVEIFYLGLPVAKNTMESIYDEKIQSNISQEFSRIKDVCYLDHAGATLYSERQIKNISEDLINNVYGNPHSLNHSSKESLDLVDQVRNKILKHFHTSQDEYSLIFTSGATAAIKLVLEHFDWEGNTDDEEFFDSQSVFIDDSNAPPGAYIYTESNHTSIVGGREIAKDKQIPFYCLEYEQAYALMREEIVLRKPPPTSNSLFAYPAQCNFSGRKYPLEWIKKIQRGILDSYGMETGRRNSKWFCLLDAATYCSTNDLNLSVVHPDFVCLSFYKIFGYPTGLGALLVRNSSAYVLKKKYFGGGTVEISLPAQDFHKARKVLHERFEDGTISYLSIISLEHGFKTLNRLNLTMKLISNHVFELAKYCVEKLKNLSHWNGTKVVELYADSNYDDVRTQGGIVNFNLKKANRQFVGFVEVLHMANLRKIYIRTGCFCNSGACQRHLKLSDADLKLYHQAGHVCGDSMDLINGRPTGSIRVSFGYMTTHKDVNKLITMIKECFVETSPQMTNQSKFIGTGRITLSKILVFPIKSCGAMNVNTWQLNDKGLEYDREWMITTDKGVCLTQKQEPRLCLIVPKLDLINQILTLAFGSDTISIQINNNSISNEFDLCDSKVCNDLIQANDCGDEVSDWLGKHLNRDGLRLVRQAKNNARKSRKADKEENAAKLSLSNQAQYLLINNESVRWLQQNIGTDDEIDVDSFPDRFRGNFYIDGGREFSELTWTRLAIGNTQFKVEGPCGRCQMICIDQRTGEKSKKTLVGLSRALSGKLQFGIYLSHVQQQDRMVVSVGDFISLYDEE